MRTTSTCGLGQVMPVVRASACPASAVRRASSRWSRRCTLMAVPQASSSVLNYLSQKPQGKFGKHQYSVGERDQIARERKIFVRYQQFHHVPEEV